MEIHCFQWHDGLMEIRSYVLQSDAILSKNPRYAGYGTVWQQPVAALAFFHRWEAWDRGNSALPYDQGRPGFLWDWEGHTLYDKRHLQVLLQ